MNLLLITAVVTNILFHPWWETGNYDAWVLKKNDMPLSMTNQVHWMTAHTTTNAPSFHITSWAQYGWTNFEWTDNLTNEWSRLNCNHKQYPSYWDETYLGDGVTQIDYRHPIFKVYMHPESEVTKRMLRTTTGFFRMTTHWNNHIYSVDMEGFWPEFCGPMPLNTNTTTGIPALPTGDIR